MFLSLDEATRGLRLIFKDSDGVANLDHVLQADDSDALDPTRSSLCFLNDKNLVASSVDHPGCLEYFSLSKLQGEDEVVVPGDFTCSCSALKLANLISEEALALAGRKTDDRHSLALLRSNLVKWVPNE